MMKRTSSIYQLKVNAILIGGMLQVGDCKELTPRANVLAVARQLPIFSEEKEEEFEEYETFFKRVPIPIIQETIHMKIEQQVPTIHVDRVHVYGISTAGVVQVGSNEKMDTRSRTKHFRQFLFPPPKTPKA